MPGLREKPILKRRRKKQKLSMPAQEWNRLEARKRRQAKPEKPKKKSRKKRRVYNLGDCIKWATSWDARKRKLAMTDETPAAEVRAAKNKLLVGTDLHVEQLDNMSRKAKTYFPNHFTELTDAEEKTKEPPKKLKKVECPGSGRVAKVMAEVSATLLDFVTEMRGVNPKDDKQAAEFLARKAESLREGEELEYFKKGKRLYITYADLIDRIRLDHAEVYKTAKHEVWYTRVRRWCKKKGIVRRKATASSLSPEKAVRAAEELDTLLDEVAAAVSGEEKLRRGQIVNLDETSLRILALSIMTLHWRGDKNCEKPTRGAPKLCLSMPIVWYADGTFDFVIVYKSSSKKKGQRWHNIKGVFWFEAESKWSRQETYHHILRYFLSLGREIKYFFDDNAPGHSGSPPDYFLKSIGVRRFRIPKCTTGLAQPAAQSFVANP